VLLQRVRAMPTVVPRVRPRSRNGWRRLCADWVPTARKRQGTSAKMMQSQRSRGL
jgi:hypothetical protein